MNFKRLYPKTKTVKADVLSAEGYVNLGCKVKEGSLLPALSAEECGAEIPENVKFAQYSYVNKNYVICADGYFYMSDDGINFTYRRTLAAQKPNLVEMSGHLTVGAFIIGDERFLYFNNLGTNSQKVTAGIRSVVLKNGRFMGVDVTNPIKIKWSGEVSYADWAEKISGAGWVVVENGYGEILNLVVYKDFVVVVREYGLTLFDAHGNPENYRLQYIDGRTPKIYADTAMVVDGLLVFYTADGFYSYDGSSVKKIEFYLADDILDPVYAAVSEKSYIICGNSKSLKKEVVLVAEIGEKNAYLIDNQAEAISCGEKIFTYSDGKVYNLKEGLEYTFTSGEIDFSSIRKKVLKEVVIDGEGETEIEVSNGVNSRILRGVRGKIRVNLRGNKFKITLKSANKIKSVYAVAEVIDDD